MDPDKLRQMLGRTEYGVLEFKSEWYKINDPNDEVAKRQKGELVKDILSLANGNAIVAGEQAYLVIGADNKLNADGTRNTYDVGDVLITSKQIQQIVNNVCDPPLEEIRCEEIILDGKRLFLVVVPPTPHLYETTERITVSKRNFDKHTVFVRHGEEVDTASAKERDKILRLKQFAFSESRNAPPIAFGAVIGALAGGAAGSSMASSELVASKGNWLIGGILGMSVGSFLGSISGYIYRSYYEIRSRWFRVPLFVQVISVAAGLLGATAFWVTSIIARERLQQWMAHRTSKKSEAG